MSSVRVDARLAQRGVEFDVALDDGEVLAVLGPNGVGKSTLLLMIAGLLRPDHGRIVLGGTVVTDTDSGRFVPAHARGVAMLSQQAMLFPHMTAAANVAYAPRCKGQSRSAAPDHRTALARRGRRGRSRRSQARAAVGRPGAARRRRPRAGCRTTTAAARRTDGGPGRTAAPALRRLLRDILRREGRTAIIVTHDLLDALAIADKVIVVDGGRVVERGAVRDVLSAPRSDFAARIAGINLVPGVISQPGVLRTAWGADISGIGSVEPGTSAIALFRPASVAVHLDPPHASPRNVIAVTIAELDIHGTTVRIRGTEQPDGGTGLAADITAASAADLDLEPGRTVHFVVKTQEVQLHPALPATRATIS